MTFQVNGKIHEVSIQDGLDTMVTTMGLGNVSTKKAAQLIAPMPGLVLDINVTEGQKIKQGATLLILEAMKMENILKAAHDVTIKKIHISKKQAVDKGQILIEFE